MDTQTKQAVPARLLLNPVHLFSLGFGSGLSPKMPGTIGTLAGLLIYLILMPSHDWRLYAGVVLVGFIIGIFLCAYTARVLNVHDHPGIVWDEIIGYWLTMFLVPKTWMWIIIGFVLFRFFDILKPWPISILDKKVKGGLGIMLDDVIAAIFSLLIIQIFLYLL